MAINIFEMLKALLTCRNRRETGHLLSVCLVQISHQVYSSLTLEVVCIDTCWPKDNMTYQLWDQLLLKEVHYYVFFLKGWFQLNFIRDMIARNWFLNFQLNVLLIPVFGH